MSETRTQNKNITWCGTQPSAEVVERATKIKLLLMDVDGVLTDGKVYFVPAADNSTYETKGIYCHDGLAFNLLHEVGIKTGFISGRESQAIKDYAAHKHVQYVYQGHLQKLGIYQEILADSKLTDAEVAYIGDDITDVPLFKHVGLACAVANARNEVKPHAHFITQVPGGNGALREIAELILKAQKKWDQILTHYDCL